ncbi:MAG: hypothetical protein ABL908_08610 [Hyphomicrobium sp.]
MTQHSPDIVDRPVCQAETPAQCSNCNMAYDCARVRSGRPVSWALVALAIVLVLTLLSRMATGS